MAKCEFRHLPMSELRSEMQYDCNHGIRTYAAKRRRTAERKTNRGNVPDERTFYLYQ